MRRFHVMASLLFVAACVGGIPAAKAADVFGPYNNSQTYVAYQGIPPAG